MYTWFNKYLYTSSLQDLFYSWRIQGKGFQTKANQNIKPCYTYVLQQAHKTKEDTFSPIRDRIFLSSPTSTKKWLIIFWMFQKLLTVQNNRNFERYGWRLRWYEDNSIVLKLIILHLNHSHMVKTTNKQQKTNQDIQKRKSTLLDPLRSYL